VLAHIHSSLNWPRDSFFLFMIEHLSSVLAWLVLSIAVDWLGSSKVQRQSRGSDARESAIIAAHTMVWCDASQTVRFCHCRLSNAHPYIA